MPYIADHKSKFADLDFNIDNQDQLRSKANGGNSILFSYPSSEESLYIAQAREHYRDIAGFIDVSQLLVQFIDEDGWEDFAEYYKEYSSTPDKVFKSSYAEDVDLFDLIIAEIKRVSESDKIPVLIRSGCLYGTGIENVNIMEHRDIMNLRHPLVLFYPSSVTDDNVLFLNFKPASKYRCILVK